MVGTTVAFRVMTMEALAPWSHLQIPQQYSRYHMSTYFASHQVNGSDQLLNGRLGGYYRGLVPQVPWVTCYGPEIGYDQFPHVVNGWGTIHRIPDIAPPPLLADEEGSLT
jgi:hypothetical protein